MDSRPAPHGAATAGGDAGRGTGERERAVAITAIVLASMLSAYVCIVALMALSAGGAGSGLRGDLKSLGAGSGDGSGIGAGSGTGSGESGAGPGAGTSGDGRGVAGTAGEETLPGTPSEAPEPAAAAAPEIEPPKYGFTSTEEPPPEPTPVPDPASAPSFGHGGDAAGGASGERGGGGLRIAEVVENFPDSRCGINLDVTSSMASSRDALAVIIPELFGVIREGTITVRTFGDVEFGERNRVVLPPTRRTKDPKRLRSMIDRVLAIPLEGGGDAPETGYQLVIESMRRSQPGPKDRPNVEFIITDAPEKQAHRLQELLALAKRSNTRVFVILTSYRPPMRTELTLDAGAAEEEAP
jgi:hypothetical protein